MDGLQAPFEAMGGDGDDTDAPKAQRDPVIEAECLRDLLASLHTKHSFKVGDIVRWKTGMAVSVPPREGGPAIVVELLDAPVFDAEDSCGMTYFRQPLDMIIGVRASETRDSFLLFHVDSRRFEPFPADELRLPGEPA